jgi:GNAT superfamily N-acetyltransferase
VRYFLAWDEDLPRAYFSAWPGEHGIGLVEDLFTEPAFRHRGLATALIARCVKDARARGAELVVIGGDANDTPRHMYAAMGFRPLMLTRQYSKAFAAPAP